MIDKIRQVLAASGADAWEIRDHQETGWEFYLIGHRLDQHRVKKIHDVNLTVYRRTDDGKMLGNASGSIHVTSTDEEIKKVVETLMERALLARNPLYTLNQPDGEKAVAETGDDELSCEENAKAFLLAIRDVPETKTEDLNSVEIFTSMCNDRYMNSEGVDVSSRYPSSMVEAVVNARQTDGAGEKEIELYRMYHSGTCDQEGIKKQLQQVMEYGRDKLRAVQTPALGAFPVIFSTDAALEIYHFFLDRLSAGYIYRRYSDWTPGKMVMENEKGEKLTMKAVPMLPNSSRNTRYDREGAPIREMVLIENNTVRNNWGSRQQSQYIGLDQSFIVSNVEVAKGSQSSGTIRSGDYLEIVEFSDFQVDSITGDIAGEIRLGYLHRDGKTVPVSGGSVSGNLAELSRTMQFSRERTQYNNFLIPSLTRLEGVSITQG
ncbi:MAG: TldD/PmbA family protein [Clostridia bacterium]|nr:TldD/PmbA family protein [Clostridia bacterium]